MKCPQCSQPVQVVGKFAICPEHGSVQPVEDTRPPDASGAREHVLTRFPFPVAYGYRAVVEPESASHAVDSAFYTYTALLRFVALVFLSQFLHASGQNPRAARAIQRLRIPTLESWFSASTALAKHLFPPLPGFALTFSPFAEGGPFAPSLAAAARRLATLKLDGVLVHERLRNLRNKERAHGAPWDEADCRQRLPEIRGLLETALDLFEPLADLELLRRSPTGLVTLNGANDRFAAVPLANPRPEDLFDESETVLRNADGELLPLYPLFLGGEDDARPTGYLEPMLTFDGHDQTSVSYLGVRSRCERQDVLARYLDLLRAKDIDPRFTRQDFAPWSVTQWARESSLGTVDNLRSIKYFPAFYTERQTQQASGKPSEEADGAQATRRGVDDVVQRWLDRGRVSALIVAAEAGPIPIGARMVREELGHTRNARHDVLTCPTSTHVGYVEVVTITQSHIEEGRSKHHV